MEQQQIHKVDLFTSDLYQFTCSYAYYISGKHDQTATFEIFFRKYPFGGKYVILAGIRAVEYFLDHLQFNEEQEKYLKHLFPHMHEDYFLWIRNHLKGTIKIKSMKEGELVFAKQPLITYTGPLAIVQLLETPILNLIGFASLVATNASRMVKAVHPKKCLQFGTRRAQGPDGAYTAAEYAYLGGFFGTSNINIGKQYSIPCVGTMSHAYVTAFKSLNDICDFQINGVNIKEKALEFKKQQNLITHEGQLASFLMYAKAFPKNFTCLIDTYSVLDSGILNTIIVAKALLAANITDYGIRLDSGDLRVQSIQCRKIWAKFFPDGPKLTIIASDDLHEERLVEIQSLGSEIDVFAIGTNIATCKKQPALGLVCKLVELDKEPKMKFSADQSKATYPALKTVYRVWSSDRTEVRFDIIALQGENISENCKLYDPLLPEESLEFQCQQVEIMNHYWEQMHPIISLNQCKVNLEQSKKVFEDIMQLKEPKMYQVYMTEKYMKVFNETLLKNKVDHHQLVK